MKLFLFSALCAYVSYACGYYMAKEVEQQKAPLLPQHEYQFELEPEHIIVYDSGRYVGVVPIEGTPLDSLMLIDNQ